MKELIIAFALAQSADMVTTHIGMSRGCVEANPVYRTVNNSIPAMYAIKGGYVGFMSTFAWKGRKTHPRAFKAALWAGLAVGTGAAIWNGFQIPKC